MTAPLPPPEPAPGAEYAAPATAEQIAAIEAKLGVAAPETLAAYLARSNGAAFMEPAHRFTSYFPDGEVEATLQWLFDVAEIVAQTELWRSPLTWTGEPGLPRQMLVIGTALDDVDRGILALDLRAQSPISGAVTYRRLGFDPALSSAGDLGAHGFVAADLDVFLHRLAGI